MATHCPPTAVECGKATAARPSPHTLGGGFAGSSYVGPACLHLHDMEDAGQGRFRAGGLRCLTLSKSPLSGIKGFWPEYWTECRVLP